MNTPKDQQSEEINENECLDISICFQGAEASVWQPSNLGEYKQLQAADGAQGECIRPCVPLSLWKSTPTRETSCDSEALLQADRTSQEFQFTPISETITPNLENSSCCRWDFPVQVQVMQENELDSSIQSQHFGEKELEYCSKLNPSSVLLNSLKELLDEDFELLLDTSIWQDIQQKLSSSRQQALGLDTRDSDCLSFPTLTSGQTSSKMRPAGQTKCEKWFKDNGLIPNGSQLGTSAIASMMGFPSDWFEGLSEQYSLHATTPSQVKHQEESEPDILQDEQSPQPKQRSLSVESSISIPCLVKQPNQPEVKGIIQKDLGDRFLVDISDELIIVSKLFVYPDFSKTVPQGYNIGQISPTKKVAPPSKNSPSKTRRKKGDGTGYIYRRTITRRGKQYPESYFRYRDESGKLQAKYIPQKLIDKVQEAESLKKPIADILVLLGGDEISRGEQFDTLDVQNNDENNQSNSVSRGEQVTPPSKRRPKGLASRRKQGCGTGYIECKPIKRSGKEYKQYWYHYEEWREGDRLSKKSRYIPKRLVARVEKLEAEKAPVRKILEVLGKR
jgi:hypothetical protein